MKSFYPTHNLVFFCMNEKIGPTLLEIVSGIKKVTIPSVIKHV